MRYPIRLALCLALFSACGTAATTSDDDLELADGKSDDYYSASSVEYFGEGESFVTIEPALKDKSDSMKLARAKELLALKNIVIGYFLHVRVVDKEEGSGEHGDKNAETYPGFHALVRDGEYDDGALKIQPDGITYNFKFKLQLVGQKKLIDKLPGEKIDGTHKKISLAMGKISNDDMAKIDPESEWFRDDKWDAGKFDPATFKPADLEMVDMTISPQPVSTDAYPDINKLYKDGKLTIDVHFGWDYWSRFDIKMSKDLYEQLTKDGFASSAPSYAKYDPVKHGPLTKSVMVNGKSAQVAIRLFHSAGPNNVEGPNPDTDAGGIEMEKRMLDSLSNSEVIIFAGHSGNYYGFALANWKKTSRGALDYPALIAAKMPKDQYQIVMSSGCQTFSTGEAFRQNTSKPDFHNLDVFTTVSFSEASTNDALTTLFDGLYAHMRGSQFDPQTYQQILSHIDAVDVGALYGLHGIDDNPRLHPFANTELLGQKCNTSTDCGGIGDRCVATGAKKICASVCLGDDACPTGYKCKKVASGTSIVGSLCVK